MVFVALAGCNREKVAATVGNDKIGETEFYERASRMSGAAIPNGMDAGSAALISLIREKMTEQLAKSKNVTPTDAEIKALADYQMKMDPKYEVLIQKGQLSQEELNRSFKYRLQEFGIGTEGAKADAKKIEAEYNKYKDMPIMVASATSPSGQTPNPVKRAALYVVRLMQMPNEARAKQALEHLQKTGDFKGLARAMTLDPQQVENAGREMYLPKEIVMQSAPALEAELAKLSDGQFTPKPVSLSSPTPGSPTVSQNVYLIAQLVRKLPELTFTLQEASAELTTRVMEADHPDWNQHKDQEMAKYTKSLLDGNKIQINIERLKSVRDTFVRTMADANTPTAPGGSLGAPKSVNPAPQSAPPAGKR
jgi:hypothetical protein